MINVDVLKPYLLQMEDRAFALVKQDIENLGVEDAFSKYLTYMDCTRWSKSGTFRLMQTIGFPYCKAITELIWIVENHISEKDKESYIAIIITQHEKNVAYEVEHPPVWYSNKKTSKKDYQKEYDASNNGKPKRSRKYKEQTIDGFSKETVAERKIKQHVAKINVLKFNIKPK